MLREPLDMNNYCFILMLGMKLPRMPKVIAYDYLMHNDLVPREINPITLDKGLARLIPLMQGIESNEFDATPAMRTCKYCDHSSLCPDKA